MRRVGVLMAVLCAVAAATWHWPGPAAALASERHPSVTAPSHGESGQAVTVSGRGFPPRARVEIFLDRVDVASTATGPHGAFPATGVGLPVTATPGRHWITALDPASGAAAQAPVRVEDPWPQARGGPTLVGLNGAESAIGSLNASTLTEVWHGDLGEPSPGEPAVDGAGRSYVATPGRVAVFPSHCAGACSPVRVLRVPGAKAVTPALSSGFLYVGGHRGVEAFRSTCGSSASCRAAWTGDTGRKLVGSLTVGSGLLIGASGSHVYAFPEAGCAASPCPPRWVADAAAPVLGSVAVGYGSAYVATGDGSVEAFGPGTGHLRWQVAVGESLASSPVVAQEPWSQPAVYVVSRSGTLHVMNAYTGTALWTGAAQGPASAAPAVAYGDVYVATDTGVLAAFSTVACKQPPCPPAWTASVGGALTAPTVANGVAFVGSDAGSVVAFNARSGVRLWSADVGGPVRAQVAVAGGTLFATTAVTTSPTGTPPSGSLIAFRPAGAPAPPRRPNPSSLHPAATPIRHVVVVFQENHSFDDTLGALCVQDARCDGAVTGHLPDGSTIPLATAPDLVPEVDHTAQSQATAVDGERWTGSR